MLMAISLDPAGGVNFHPARSRGAAARMLGLSGIAYAARRSAGALAPTASARTRREFAPTAGGAGVLVDPVAPRAAVVVCLDCGIFGRATVPVLTNPNVSLRTFSK